MSTLFGDITSLTSNPQAQAYLQGLQGKFNQAQEQVNAVTSQQNRFPGALAALAGALVGRRLAGGRGALAMGLLGPLLANSYNTNMQNNAIDALGDYRKGLMDTAKFGLEAGQLAGNAELGRLGTGANLGAFLSNDTAKTALAAASAARNKAAGLKAIKAGSEWGFQQGQANSLNPIQQFAKSVINPNQGQLINMEQPELQGLILQAQTSRNNMVDAEGKPIPMQYAGFEDPTVINNLLDNTTSAINTGMTQGVRSSLIPSEIEQNQSSAKANNAIAELRQIMAKFYPDLVKAQIYNYNERPMPNEVTAMQGLFTPSELRQMYANKNTASILGALQASLTASYHYDQSMNDGQGGWRPPTKGEPEFNNYAKTVQAMQQLRKVSLPALNPPANPAGQGKSVQQQADNFIQQMMGEKK